MYNPREVRFTRSISLGLLCNLTTHNQSSKDMLPSTTNYCLLICFKTANPIFIFGSEVIGKPRTRDNFDNFMSWMNITEKIIIV